ncbi:hypothetical protein C1I93_20970 [Micromonospora endophytica]|uniref:Right handed beta helix region n=2 Tax=Micromonospora endophytica TaxID=515350 RepID=A0A2W2CJ01_9ACTN|nr:hypothetical protein C1I93_20970 [Micromonospora endophytica]RIW40632.1 hypothetical protein D3H59_28765 [Micromonospora endophytica]
MAAGVAGLTGVVGLAALGGVAARDRQNDGQEHTSDAQPATAPQQDIGAAPDKDGVQEGARGAEWSGRGGPGGERPDRPTAKQVPCDSDKLIQAVTYANANHGGILELARGCTYELTRSDRGNGLPVITQAITLAGQDTRIERAANADPFRILNVGRDGHLTLRNVTVTGGQTPADLIALPVKPKSNLGPFGQLAPATSKPAAPPAAAPGAAPAGAPAPAPAAVKPAAPKVAAAPATAAVPEAAAAPKAAAGPAAAAATAPKATATAPKATAPAAPKATAAPAAATAAAPKAAAAPAAAAAPKVGAGPGAESVVGPSDGAGLLVQRGGRADIEHSNFSTNHSGGNGGAVANYGTTRLAHTIVERNSAAGTGGGVFNTGVLRVEDSKVVANSAGVGGGGIGNGVPQDRTSVPGGTTWVWRSTISHNRTAGIGGGLLDVEGTTTMSQSQVTDNNASVGGGGIVAYHRGQLALERVLVARNSTDGDAGGVAVSIESTTVIEQSAIRENVAGNAGGGLYAWHGEVVLRDSEVVANQAIGQHSVGGGGIVNNLGRVRLERSTVEHNVSVVAPGGIATVNDGVTLDQSAVTGNRPTNCAGSPTIPERCFG